MVPNTAEVSRSSTSSTALKDKRQRTCRPPNHYTKNLGFLYRCSICTHRKPDPVRNRDTMNIFTVFDLFYQHPVGSLDWWFRYRQRHPLDLKFGLLFPLKLIQILIPDIHMISSYLRRWFSSFLYIIHPVWFFYKLSQIL